LQTSNIRIDRGIRQECIFSSLLFNIFLRKNLYFLTKIFQFAFEGHMRMRIKINGISINNLRYADDTAILPENIQELQIIINEIGKKYDLSINVSKTKLMMQSSV